MVGAAPTATPPRCPQGVLPETRRLWRSLWKSRVSQAWDRESDLPAVVRYVRLLDRWLRYDAMVTQTPLVRGSREQVRPNPLAVRIDAIEGQVRSLEDQLGLTPAARVRLGISLVEARTALERWQDDEEDEGEDPRLALRREASPWPGRTMTMEET